MMRGINAAIMRDFRRIKNAITGNRVSLLHWDSSSAPCLNISRIFKSSRSDIGSNSQYLGQALLLEAA